MPASILEAMVNTKLLLETVGDILMAAQTSDRAKLNIIWVVSNLLASPSRDLCIAVIFRTRILSFLDRIKMAVPDDMLFTLPWLVANLLKDGPVLGMTPTNVTSLVVLLGNNLTKLKQVKKTAEPLKAVDADRSIGDILKATKSLKESKSLKNIDVQELTWLLNALR